MSEAEKKIEKLMDEVITVASFLVGYGDVAEIAARRLRRAVLECDPDFYIGNGPVKVEDQ